MNQPPAPDHLTPLAAALRRLAQVMDSQSKLLESAAGLTASQWLCLQALAQAGAPLAARDLAEAVSLTPGTVSAVLDRLEAKGWVRRTRATDDRRRIDLEITPEGRTQWRRAPGVLPAEGVERFLSLSAGQQRSILKALDQLVETLSCHKESTRTP
jgi:DNA-binding MarR family transcriptional regulator